MWRFPLRSTLLLLGLTTLGHSTETLTLTVGAVHFDGRMPERVELLVEPSSPVSMDAKAYELVEDAEATVRGKVLQDFRTAGWSAAVVLAVDVSGSMSGFIPKPPRRRNRILEAVPTGADDARTKSENEVAAALKDFAGRLKDRLSLVSFADSAEVLAPFDEKSSDNVVQAIDRLRISGNNTEFHAGLDTSLNALKGRASPRERQRIIVISDGIEDTGKPLPGVSDIINLAVKQQVAIDTVWIDQGIPHLGKDTLSRLSENTGGLLLEAKDATGLAASLQEIRQRIERALVISFERTPSTALTKTIAVRLAQYEAISAPIAFQMPRSETSLSGRIIALIRTFAVPAALLGVLILLAVVYLLVAFSKRLWPFGGGTVIQDPSPGKNSDVKGPRHRPTIVAHETTAGQLSLKVLKGPLEGKTIPVRGSALRIGAAGDNDLRIDSDIYVSGHHAMLESSERGWVLTDNGSSNGTLLDGQKLKSGQGYILRDGQSIQCGASEFRVVLDRNAAASPDSK